VRGVFLSGERIGRDWVVRRRVTFELRRGNESPGNRYAEC